MDMSRRDMAGEMGWRPSEWGETHARNDEVWGKGDQDGMWSWSPVIEMEWRAMRGSVWKVKRGHPWSVGSHTGGGPTTISQTARPSG